MRKRLTIALFCCIFQVLSLDAQRLELGVFGGISNYFGDLQQSNFEVETVHPAVGVFSRYNVNNRLAVKLHLYKGAISGNDSNYPELMPVRERNLSFRSDIYEAGLQAEFTFVSFGENEQKLAAPYIFSGISLFYFNPQAEYQGRWIDLQPLGTEGQGMGENAKYNRVQLSIPMGIGFNVRVAPKMNVGFEFGFRKTFTDHLDDVSGAYPDIDLLQEINPMGAALSFRAPELVDYAIENPEGDLRGTPETKDMYFFGGMTISILLKK
jgi:hypothetical protein